MITFNIINKSIIGSVNGKPFNVPYDKKLWAELLHAQGEYSKADTPAHAKKVIEGFEKLIEKKTYADTIEEITPYVKYDPKTKTHHLYDPNTKRTSVIPLPEIIVNKMKYAHDEGLPTEPLVKFVTRALRNPILIDSVDATRFLESACIYAFKTFVSPSLKQQFLDEGYTEEIATDYATVFQTPITMEGLLSTKKVVTPLYDTQRYKFKYDDEGNPKKVLRDDVDGVGKTLNEETGEESITDPTYAEDWVFQPAIMGTSGDAFLCGDDPDGPLGHILKVGQEMRLPDRKMVDWDPNHTYVKGLHCGNQDYINTYETSYNVTLDCLVDPANTTFPYNTSDGAIRTVAMMPTGIKNREVDNRNLYHSSDYAAKLDAIWAKERAAIMDKFDEEKEEFLKQLEARKAKVGE